MTFVQRLVNLSVKLAASTGTNQPITFTESGTDTVDISGLRTSVRIQNSGAPADCRATVKVWGLTESIQNQLATLGLVFNIVPRNTITISAGDTQYGISTVFSGTIYNAYGDYSAQPKPPFIFVCLSGVADSVAPAAVSSFDGSTSVANIMAGLARQLNLGFENNGVTAVLSNPYLRGSLWKQVEQVARHADISWGVLNGNLLAIWPKGGNRNTPNIPIISAATGMVDYPAFTQQGIIVKTLFNPQISFGSLIKVDSTLLSAISRVQQEKEKTFPTQWAVNKLDLLLDSMVPHGDWISVAHAYNPNYSKALLPPTNG